MSAGRYPAALALEAAQLFAANLAYCCERIALAGSLRRWVSAGYQPADRTVGDVELVAIPRLETRKEREDLFSSRELTVNLLWERCEAIYDLCPITDKNGRTTFRNGDVYKKLEAPLPLSLGDGVIPLDLFTATVENWGFILATRTGPHEFNMIWALTREKGGMRPAGVEMRQGTVYVDGEPVATPTEESFFEIVGLPWLEPHEREDPEIRKLVRNWRARGGAKGQVGVPV